MPAQVFYPIGLAILLFVVICFITTPYFIPCVFWNHFCNCNCCCEKSKECQYICVQILGCDYHQNDSDASDDLQ